MGPYGDVRPWIKMWGVESPPPPPPPSTLPYPFPYHHANFQLPSSLHLEVPDFSILYTLYCTLGAPYLACYIVAQSRPSRLRELPKAAMIRVEPSMLVFLAFISKTVNNQCYDPYISERSFRDLSENIWVVALFVYRFRD